MIKARFLPEAEAEFLREVSYYSNAAAGLGLSFERAVEAAVRMSVVNPDGGTSGPKGTRRRMIKGFPFSLVYRASNSEIVIVALAHHRKKPGYWKGRV